MPEREVVTPRPVPTAGSVPVFGILPGILRDPFNFLIRTAGEHDGIVRLRVGGRDAFLLSRPEYVHHVLVLYPHRYQRGPVFDTFRAVVGEGLFTTDGACGYAETGRPRHGVGEITAVHLMDFRTWQCSCVGRGHQSNRDLVVATMPRAEEDGDRPGVPARRPE